MGCQGEAGTALPPGEFAEPGAREAYSASRGGGGTDESARGGAREGEGCSGRGGGDVVDREGRGRLDPHGGESGEETTLG